MSHVTRQARPLLLALVVTVGGACGGDDGLAPGEEVLVTGTWSGTTTIGLVLTLTMTESSSGVVSGTGTFGSDAAVLHVPIQQGSHNFPNLSLTIVAGGDILTFLGTVESQTRIEGRFNGSGLFNAPLTLTKN